jgi:hypothetical protein
MSDLDIAEFGPCSCAIHDRRTGEIMPHWRSLVESKYLSHFELQGRDVTVTIKTVQLDTVIGSGGKKSRKALLHFVGKSKGMVAGVTVLKAIASLYGDDYAGWSGKAVTLYPTTTEASGETVGTIRVRPMAPSGKPLAVVEREPGDDSDSEAEANG